MRPGYWTLLLATLTLSAYVFLDETGNNPSAVTARPPADLASNGTGTLTSASQGVPRRTSDQVDRTNRAQAPKWVPIAIPDVDPFVRRQPHGTASMQVKQAAVPTTAGALPDTTPPAPAPVESQAAPSPASSPPLAGMPSPPPAVNLRYIGMMRTVEGDTLHYLSRDNTEMVVRPGMTVDNGYVVERTEREEVVLMHPPSGNKVVLKAQRAGME
jgi:hypothetical protein